jgi:hypothetical protein
MKTTDVTRWQCSQALHVKTSTTAAKVYFLGFLTDVPVILPPTALDKLSILTFLGMLTFSSTQHFIPHVI